MDQADRNPREQNHHGGQNKPRKTDDKDELEKSRDNKEGRDDAPPHRPGGDKSPWLGGG
jgi:hypothetical protein